jgi:hypothetical protein
MSDPAPRLMSNGVAQFSDDTAGADDELPVFLDIEIDPPIELGGKTYAVLHLREPTGDQLERAELELANGVTYPNLRKYSHALIAQVAGVPAAVVKKMRVTQIREASDFLARYVSGGPPIGGI